MHNVKGVNFSSGSARCGVPAIAIYKCVCPKVNKVFKNARCAFLCQLVLNLEQCQHVGVQDGVVVNGMGLSSIMGVVPTEHEIFVLPTRGPRRSSHGLESESHASLGSISDV